MSLQLVCLGCLSILVLVFVITQILHLSRRTDHGLFPSRHSQILLFFLMKTCASHLTSVQVALSKSHRSRLDTSFFAHDGRDPRSWPQTKPCRGQHVLEQSYTANQHGAWIICARCALRLHYIPRHTSRMTSVSTPSSASVQEALN